MEKDSLKDAEVQTEIKLKLKLKFCISEASYNLLHLTKATYLTISFCHRTFKTPKIYYTFSTRKKSQLTKQKVSLYKGMKMQALNAASF